MPAMLAKVKGDPTMTQQQWSDERIIAEAEAIAAKLTEIVDTNREKADYE